MNQLGDPVEAAISQDVFLGTTVMLSKNDRLRGRIDQLEPPIQGRHAILGVTFDRLVLNTGEEIPITALVKTGQPNQIWGGQITPGTEAKLVTHKVLGLGGFNKTVLAGPRRVGDHIQRQPGEPLTLILTQPLTLVVPKSY
jgi:hypothetical protein